MKIYQIYYSEDTRNNNDKGFLQLDNSENERADWREYWPIRKFLNSEALDSNKFYGFFSPKFHEKTGLTSNEVYQFLEENKDSQICSFSPYFDQSSLFINVFEQSNWAHPDTIKIYSDLLRIMNVNVGVDEIIMTSQNIIFCNYFAAKPIFWQVWLAHCELIFNLAERNDSDFAKRINSYVSHFGGDAQLKVFVIERIASLLLYLNKWDVRVFPTSMDTLVVKKLEKSKNDLYVMNALKIAYNQTDEKNYLQLYLDMRRKYFKY